MTVQCNIHGTEMKLVPSGISKKTGRRYNAFYACTDMTCKETAPAANEVSVAPQKPLTSVSEEEPMKRLDWSRKEFIKGLAVFSSNERQQGMSPVEAIKSSHTFDWMYTAYGDDPAYESWAKDALLRVKKLSAMKNNQMTNEMIEAFDKSAEDLQENEED